MESGKVEIEVQFTSEDARTDHPKTSLELPDATPILKTFWFAIWSRWPYCCDWL